MTELERIRLNEFEALHTLELKTTQEATMDSLKSQYRKMVMKYHPDKPTGDAKRFMQVKEAYELLEKLLQIKTPKKNTGPSMRATFRQQGFTFTYDWPSGSGVYRNMWYGSNNSTNTT